MKRMRPDFEDRGHRGGGGGFGMHDYGGMYGGYGDPYGGLAAPFGAVPAQRELPPPASDGMTQPAMMTLKQFLATQDDSIPDDVAITKYSEYKLEFKRNQLNEFFVAHKDEEWWVEEVMEKIVVNNRWTEEDSYQYAKEKNITKNLMNQLATWYVDQIAMTLIMVLLQLISASQCAL